MAKAKKHNQIGSIFFMGNLQQSMVDATNLARWNPDLAIQWMEYINSRINSDVEIALWVRCADNINETIEMKQNWQFYNEREYWGPDDKYEYSLDDLGIKPRFLEVPEDMRFDLQDMLALNALYKLEEIPTDI